MAVTVIKTYSRRKAAPKKSKTGLIIGISFIIIAGGLGIYFWYKNKKEKEALLLNPATSTDSQNTINTSTISKKIIDKKILDEQGYTLEDNMNMLIQWHLGLKKIPEVQRKY